MKNLFIKDKLFFEEQGAKKAFALAQGLEWDGEEGIDDFC